MPNNCHECNSYGISDVCWIPCPCEEDLSKYSYDGRPEGCPLIEVPVPHGRLIDADALMENAQYKGTYDVVSAYNIAAAPTIIPEEGET